MAELFVAVLDPIADGPMALLKSHATVVEPPIDQHLPDIDAIIVRASPLPAAIFEAAPRLRVIGKHGVGMDNIDLDAARQHDVAVYNTPAANADAVAELAVGLMLAVLRRIPGHDRALRAGVEAPARTGRELSNARVGLVGLGTIARKLARLLSQGFQAEVAAYDPYAQQPADLPVTLVGTLPELCARTDILSVHVPLTTETRGLIDAEMLSALPRGAIVINTSRGRVVDESALLAVLERGHLSGAGLDVLESEPPSPLLPLFDHPNVVVTPHIGASTEEAMTRMGETIVTTVLGALGIGKQSGEPVQ